MQAYAEIKAAGIVNVCEFNSRPINKKVYYWALQ